MTPYAWKARLSTYAPNARRRIAEELPAAKLIIIVRDPIDRAYSNWMHLWVDGLEPISNFEDAWRAEDSRVAAGWAPFWHYRRLAGTANSWPICSAGWNAKGSLFFAIGSWCRNRTRP